ncbi:uncharacterized protein SCHCODRAFT_02099306 [Schizophyllum commune H4-8]|uniref:uncharacterized protein n=1 Tax=Schizophyllum commune (strain H4-8 / FGSC 9210) TaxID=578458 RepID=UPI002160195B|nr:uncharacterized protein SCHCODRAFT_02099306 [Schizophyllum commune H4-8]KAI5886466.1 hypothetical protein SCHCODRAFT_02099306 [Schizophyllum commune H4-8]
MRSGMFSRCMPTTDAILVFAAAAPQPAGRREIIASGLQCTSACSTAACAPDDVTSTPRGDDWRSSSSPGNRYDDDERATMSIEPRTAQERPCRAQLRSQVLRLLSRCTNSSFSS